MKYNLDCAREILFLLERDLTISPDLEFETLSCIDIADRLNSYEITEIVNTLFLLKEAGFIEAGNSFGDNHVTNFLVSRITYEGYQFIENIRPETVWNKVKSITAKVGTFSINAITQIAVSTITTLINAQLGL